MPDAQTHRQKHANYDINHMVLCINSAKSSKNFVLKGKFEPWYDLCGDVNKIFLRSFHSTTNWVSVTSSKTKS